MIPGKPLGKRALPSGCPPLLNDGPLLCGLQSPGVSLRVLVLLLMLSLSGSLKTNQSYCVNSRQPALPILETFDGLQNYIEMYFLRFDPIFLKGSYLR